MSIKYIFHLHIYLYLYVYPLSHVLFYNFNKIFITFFTNILLFIVPQFIKFLLLTVINDDI